MTINPELHAGGGGGGGGRNAASRQTTTPSHVDLDPEVEAGADGETGSETGSETPSTEAVDSLQQVRLKAAVEKLENYCIVLGVDYKNKLLEMGVASDDDYDISRVFDQIVSLQSTIDANYKKLKVIGSDLLREWELSETPFKQMMKLAHVISVSDSVSSSEVTDAGFLSTTLVKRAQAELERLRTERKKEGKKEYEKQKKNLKEIVVENHLAWENVEFDPTKKVNAEQYCEETRNIRKSIVKARELASGRKELVFRVELVRQLIEQNELPINTIEGFLNLARKHVEKITKNVPVQYDGVNVTALLDRFKAELDHLQDEQEKQVRKDNLMRATRTRHGRSLGHDAPQDSSDDEEEEA